MRRSQRERGSAIHDDYVVYLGEHDYGVTDAVDPLVYKQIGFRMNILRTAYGLQNSEIVGIDGLGNMKS